MKLSLALAVPLALLHITSVNSRAPASSRVRRHSFGRRDDHLAAGGEDHHGGGGDAQLEVAPPAGYESSAAPAESSITYDNGSYDSAKYAGSGETWTGDASASYETTAAAEGYGAATPTEAPVAHETTDAPPAAHETTVDVKYGSGSWGNVEGGGEYDACVQKCQAKYTGIGSAAPPAPTGQDAGSPPPAAGAPGKPLSPGPHQVIVAPIKGDLRMVPFNIVAKSGSTIDFLWGAGPHTVTKSSAGDICKKNAEAGAFVSGQQNATFQFPVKVESDATQWYFCGVADHCKKGMFGLINGALVKDAKDKKSFGSWMEKHRNDDVEFDIEFKATIEVSKGTDAASWGEMLDTSQLPDWALPMSAWSILATRKLLATPNNLAGNDTSALGGTNSTVSGALPPLVKPAAATGSSASSGDPSAAAAEASGSKAADAGSAASALNVGVSSVVSMVGAVVLSFALLA